ncbi:MAG: type II toxin-antitoxin system HipA family toxin, partial [Muribaculaceae bacterium]|nr:type II toxin-antitoxin system HipA family toxin [Muribaculaceae bacterium]
MNYIKVILWGEELGRLVWDSSKRISYFVFNPDLQNRPDVSPLLRPAGKSNDQIPMYGDARRIYQNLPPFIADSLPDSWGNKLFDQWVKQQRISRQKITPLDKLTFIGKRGMGALEFQPAIKEMEYSQDVDLKSLYQLSLEILSERETISFTSMEEITFQSLLRVGTSAGGRQMKAIIAINRATGEIRSGQIESLSGFDYFIVKFEDELVPTSEIEMTFFEMATACGITMEECRLFPIEGINHFITRRFDRKNGEKIHMQTLAAINPEARSYEELMDTCRNLGLTESELQEVYRRLVFNVLANNTDDHNKNFSFLLKKGGKWELSPAYDMTFIFATNAHSAQPERCMSLYGKVSDITKEDLLDFAKENNISNAEGIISKVADAIMTFPTLADKYNIPSRWSNIIHKTIQDNLIRFGYLTPTKRLSEFTDSNNC